MTLKFRFLVEIFWTPPPIGISASTSTESANFRRSVPKRNSFVWFQRNITVIFGKTSAFFMIPNPSPYFWWNAELQRRFYIEVIPKHTIGRVCNYKPYWIKIVESNGIYTEKLGIVVNLSPSLCWANRCYVCVSLENRKIYTSAQGCGFSVTDYSIQQLSHFRFIWSLNCYLLW